MDRFSFSAGPSATTFEFGEFQLQNQDGVRIYDGDLKTQYENGELVLTSHRILWRNPSVDGRTLALPLHLVLLVQEEQGGFRKSPKVVLQLTPSLQGPASKSVIKFSFKDGGERSFSHNLHDALKQRQWEIKKGPLAPSRPPPGVPQRKIRSGIGGIEKSIQQKNQQTGSEISKAFQDLDKLMEMAKPMVALAKSISGKIRERQGEVSDDETVQFKSYLLSMGISDPVTRETHGSGQGYFCSLAKEVFKVLEKPIRESGGMMTLTDAFCRVNRARGLELLSPEDLLSACKALPSVPLPLELFTFPCSGVAVLRDPSIAGEAALKRKTLECLEASAGGSLTAEELSRATGVSVVLARERLLAAEAEGDACRDDTVEGLRFFANRFLTEKVA